MKQELGIHYWNDLYLHKDTRWDVGYITTPLKEYFDQLTNKNLFILIPGAGNAYEAEYLVNKGFKNVFVCDFAEEPLLNLKKRCPKIDQEHLLQTDFFKINNLSFDLIVEQTFFCALHPSLRKNYFKKVKELLNEKGKLTGVLFNDVLNTDGPPFGGSKEEYLEYFKDDFKINAYDTCYNSIKPREGRELFINLERAGK